MGRTLLIVYERWRRVSGGAARSEAQLAASTEEPDAG